MKVESRGLFNHWLSPVALGALTVILVVGTVAYSLRTSSVDPRVTLRQERVSYSGRSAPDPAAWRLAAVMDGEVTRLADRMAEATSLTSFAGLYLADSRLRGRLPRDVQTLVAGLAQSGLLPPGLAATNSAGTLVSAWGSLSVRYRPAPLGVEVVSIASKPEYGPALIVRIPGDTSEDGEASLYVADRLQSVTVPVPFAPAGEVIAMGWTTERLRSPK
jgi:hypothetical protein